MVGKVDVGAGMVRLRTKTSADSLADGYITPQKRKQVPTPSSQAPSSQGTGSCPRSTGQFFGKHYYFKISHIFNHGMELVSSKILQHRLENLWYIFSLPTEVTSNLLHSQCPLPRMSLNSQLKNSSGTTRMLR